MFIVLFLFLIFCNVLHREQMMARWKQKEIWRQRNQILKSGD